MALPSKRWGVCWLWVRGLRRDSCMLWRCSLLGRVWLGFLCAVTAGDTPVATVVLGWRCVANMFNGPGKALLIDHMDELIAAATPLLASPKKTLRLTGVTVLRKYVFVHAHACAWLVSVHHMWCVVPLCPQLRNAAARAGGGH